MATSRFAHYLKIIARDKIGSFMRPRMLELVEPLDIKLCDANAQSNEVLKAKFPLSEARVEVKEVAGQPGRYQAVAWLRPWLQMEGSPHRCV